MAFREEITNDRAVSGFTLIELILSLTIVSILVVLILGAFQVGQQAWSKGDAATEVNHRLRVVMERMRRQLSAAVAYADVAGENDAIPVFEGDAETMQFVSRSALAPGGDRGLVSVRYTVRDDAETGQALDFAEQPLVAMAPDGGRREMQGNAIRLLDGLTALRFAYLDRSGDTPNGSWRPRWPENEAQGLPSAVRISFRPTPDEASLDIVVRVVSRVNGKHR